jgi:hypothetical protein
MQKDPPQDSDWCSVRVPGIDPMNRLNCNLGTIGPLPKPDSMDASGETIRRVCAGQPRERGLASTRRA